MDVVHCRYGHDHEAEPFLPDCYVWLCLGAFGVDDAPAAVLPEYHDGLPYARCACGFEPFPPVPAARPDGFWEPGHP